MAAYVPQVWHDSPATDTPINAARLAVIESGLAAQMPLDGVTLLPVAQVPDLSSTYARVVGIAGAGIDPTGVADSTTAIQALLAALQPGQTVNFPSGATFKLSGTLTIPIAAAGVCVKGRAQLNWASGVQNAPQIDVLADDVEITGLRLAYTDPTAPSQTGAANIAIYCQANRTYIHGVTSTGSCSGFDVAAAVAGVEVSGHRIIGNHITVVGAGDGPANTTSTYGEDRGHGIAAWGSEAVVSDNVIICPAGHDACIGIDVEGLGGVASPAAPYPDSLVTVSGNVIRGPFRRAIAIEGVRGFAVTGNTVIGNTWWGIAVVQGSSNGVVVGNSIRWTRVSTDHTGQAWAPSIVPIMVQSAVDVIVEANHVEMDSTSAADAYLRCYVASTACSDVTIANNRINANGAAVVVAFWADHAARVRITDNYATLVGTASYGIWCPGSDSPWIEGNHLDAGTGTKPAYGALLDSTANGNTNGGIARGNRLKNFGTGIWAQSITSGVVKVDDNIIEACTTGVNLTSTTAVGSCGGNTFDAGVTTHLTGNGASITTFGNN